MTSVDPASNGRRPDLLTAFARGFAREGLSGTEYSFTEDRRYLGVMVGDRSRSFYERAVQFVADWPAWDEWATVSAEVARSTSPSTYAFRLDCLEGEVRAATLYFRHEDMASDASLFAIERQLAEVCDEADIRGLARRLGVPGPFATGVRLIPGSGVTISLYFLVRNVPAARLSEEVPALAVSHGATTGQEERLRELLALRHFDAPDFVGVGYPQRELKLQFPAVRLADFRHFGQIWEVDDRRVNEICTTVSGVGQDTLSYLGVRCSGNLDWKAYLMAYDDFDSARGPDEMARVYLHEKR